MGDETPSGTANGIPAATANRTPRDLLGPVLGGPLTLLPAALAVGQRLTHAGPSRPTLSAPCCAELTADSFPAGEVAWRGSGSVGP
jgi:hypothetical protein